MKRSAGVTAIAVLSLLGSLFTLLMGLLMAMVPIFLSKVSDRETPFDQRFIVVLMLLVSLTYIAPSVWGIATSIGLFRLKNWARVSMVVFSVVLILMSSFSGLVTTVMPMPAHRDHPLPPSFAVGMRIFMGIFWLTLLAVGIWWLVFFNRAKVKAQFVPVATGYAVDTPLPNADAVPLITVTVGTPVVPARPLSFTIIAWLMVVGSLFIPVNFALHSPAFLFARVLTGWPAAVYFLAVFVLHLYIGIGLLRLQPLARVVGVGYYSFMAVNASTFYFAPGGRARMFDLFQKAQASNPLMRAWPDAQKAYPIDLAPFYWIGVVAGLIGVLVPLYFLITRKQAFEQAAAAAH